MDNYFIVWIKNSTTVYLDVSNGARLSMWCPLKLTFFKYLFALWHRIILYAHLVLFHPILKSAISLKYSRFFKWKMV